MSSRLSSSVFLVLALLLPASRLLADTDHDIEEKLSEALKGKVVTLKHAYQSDSQHYDANGSAIPSAAEGSWTLYSKLQITGIRLHGNELKLSGDRVIVTFDNEGHQSSSRLPEDVELVIDAPVAANREAAVNVALSGVLLTPSEKLSDFVPSYWKPSVDALEQTGKAVAAAPSTNVAMAGVYKVGQDVQPPKGTSMPDPQYVEVARKHRFEGRSVLWMVVSATGEPHDIFITRPVGFGLDDAAVAAVQRWKFNPATRDGNPVAVQVNIEVNFRLR